MRVRHRRWIVAALWIVLVLCLAPLVLAFGATWLAQAHGCALQEAGSTPCIILGRDRGDALAAAFVAGWITLGTLPLAGACIVALIALALLRRAAR